MMFSDVKFLETWRSLTENTLSISTYHVIFFLQNLRFILEDEQRIAERAKNSQ